MTSIVERTAVPPGKANDARATRRARARVMDRVMTWLLWGLTGTIVLLLAYFILYTLIGGLGVISWKFITGSNVTGDYVGPEVFNTFYILVLALLICVPLGIGGAIYLAEYAVQGRFTMLVRLATETLAGVPSLVLGFFGYLIFVTAYGEGTRFGLSRLAGALTLAILNLPLIVRVSEDALRSVSTELREASYAVGASKSQTVFRVLLPTALPQFTTGIILTSGKMIGETAALIFTAGTSSPVSGWFTLNPLFPGDTLTVHLFELQSEGITPNAHMVEAGTATLLIAFLLLFNLGFRWLSAAVSRRIAGRG